MLNILTPKEMYAVDNYSINEYGVPSAILMENAARSSSIYIEKIIRKRNLNRPSVIILCGSGNNGGDGFALARHLFEKCELKCFWIGAEEKMSPETKDNFLAAKNIGVNLIKIESEEFLNEIDFSCDILIDSMIGVGGSENIRGLALSILKKITDNRALKIAIDAPTGLNTEIGFASEFCFKADYTITMFAIKTGMLLNDGMELCGKIKIANLGVPSKIVNEYSTISVLEKKDIENFFPKRKKKSSKFDYGRVLIIAGSKKYPGAAALCANAAIKSGAGLVELCTNSVHSAVLPEIIINNLDVNEFGTISDTGYNLDLILERAEKSNAIAIGPGISDNREALELCAKIIERVSKNIPVVIDADALRVVSKDSILRKNIILTPHCGEFARITELERQEVELHAHSLAKEWAEKLGCIVHLKNVPSITSDGQRSFWTVNGNPGMASAGSGDLLTGIIASFLSQGLNPLIASALASFLHGRAGDLFAKRYNEETLTASALIEMLQF
ncbi:MAG: NAD(P)H-hydrate dehydratase [Ignavibacteria bacterium]|jgi:NAD(P)H-hydrate epimerase|nr:NAD(P)H-hydrate dehydratase [Ignavibacteria bacterium]